MVNLVVRGKTVSTLMLVLLLMGPLIFAFNLPLVGAKTITVPDQYSTIQAAINAADPGDTIFVRAGTYYEQVVVNKTVLLIGENRDTTIIDGQEKFGSVVTVKANEILISNFTIRNSGSGFFLFCFGIEIEGYNYTTVRNNKIIDNQFGIGIKKSFNNKLIGNEITNNYGWGIRLEFSSNCTLRDNRMSVNGDDFAIYGNELSHFIHDIDASNLRIDGVVRRIYYLINQHDITINSSTHPDLGFLALVNSTNIKVQDLNIDDNDPGLLLAYTNNSLITGNTVIYCAKGILLIHSSNNTISGNTLGPKNNGNIILENLSSNNTISENNITDAHMNRVGISLTNSFSNTIARNNITEAGGIIIGDSGNIFGGSDNNTIVGNNVTPGGMYIYYSSNNMLRNNHVSDFRVFGDELSHFIHDIDTSNLKDGEPIYYLVNQHDITINPSTHPLVSFLGLVNSTNIKVQGLDLQGLLLAYTNSSLIIGNAVSGGGWEGILLIHSSNSTITGNNATNKSAGIRLWFSSNSTITGNNVTDNGNGIRLDESSNNNISENTVTNNSDGIVLDESSNNSVSGNNVTNNMRRASVSVGTLLTTRLLETV